MQRPHDAVTDFITAYTSHLPSNEVGTFMDSISPLLHEKGTTLDAEKQKSILNYFIETGHFYPDLFKDHPADKWLVESLIQDIDFLCTEEERTTDLPLFRDKCYEACDAYTDHEFHTILRFLRRQKQSGSLSLSQLRESLFYLTPSQSTIYRIYTSNTNPWFKLAKQQWIDQQIPTYLSQYKKSTKRLLRRQLHELDGSPDLITTLLSGAQQASSPHIARNILDLILLADLSPSSYSSTIYRHAAIPNGLQSVFSDLVHTLWKRDIPEPLSSHKQIVSNLQTVLKQSGHNPNTIGLYQSLITFCNQWLPSLPNANLSLLSSSIDRLMTYQVATETSLQALSIIKNLPADQWDRAIYDVVIEHTFGSSKDYTLDELINKIYPKNTSTDSKNKKALHRSYSAITKSYEGTTSISTLSDLPPIKYWNEAQLSKWAEAVRGSTDISLMEYLAAIMRAVELFHGYSPRITQLLSVYLLLQRSSNSSRLLQINTGEGKSLILAMASAYYGLKGNKVDIITTSVELSRPEVIKQRGFYALFGLSVAENSKVDKSQQEPEQRKKLYKSDIIYGTSNDFQGDILQTEFLGEDVLTERTFDVALVDEVDSMLYDSRLQSVRLSGLSPAMQYMEMPLAFMWQQAIYLYSHFVERDGELYLEIDEESRKIDNLTDFMNEELSDQLNEALRDLTPEEEEEWKEWNELNAQGILVGQEISQAPDEHARRTKEEESGKLQKSLRNIAWSTNNRAPILHIPPHLRSFARKQIPHWINSLLTSLHEYQKEHNYTIVNGRIAPIDYNATGVIQRNTVLGNGLTQFLEIREGLRISPEGITTNFISNIAFFKRYGSGLCGLTGTLGTSDTQSFLSQIYGADMLSIPTYKHRAIHNHPSSTYLCKELPARITNTPSSWRDTICETVLDKVRHGAAALIICQHIQTVTELRDQLASQYDAEKLFIYDGYSLFEKNDMDSGQILIATNIAGRGTDLTTSESVESNGGLHVCVTFLPESYRVELQNVGRTSRQGKKGTAQLVIHHQTANNIETVLEERNAQEQQSITCAKGDVTKMLANDHLFGLFCSFMEELFPKASLEQKRKHWKKPPKDGNPTPMNTSMLIF